MKIQSSRYQDIDTEFEKELESLLNRFSQENDSNTPDFILARYLVNCLFAWKEGITQREKWYGRTDVVTAGTGPVPNV